MRAVPAEHKWTTGALRLLRSGMPSCFPHEGVPLSGLLSVAGRRCSTSIATTTTAAPRRHLTFISSLPSLLAMRSLVRLHHLRQQLPRRDTFRCYPRAPTHPATVSRRRRCRARQAARLRGGHGAQVHHGWRLAVKVLRASLPPRNFKPRLTPVRAGTRPCAGPIHTGVANYMEFKPVDGSFVYHRRRQDLQGADDAQGDEVRHAGNDREGADGAVHGVGRLGRPGERGDGNLRV